ncbi:prolipoprotein diacylglyceryl transferase [Candidatus Woesearchaeota archaeon]|jgi:phosphatidylglycerol---prolipoprotein diacylglyceryl transferase|nr:prolipoprotein diacylglyceryl transferase [Candidatus Woesearchaeota archaeon]
MWVHNINPVLLQFGSLEIRYYGIVYVIGFFLALLWMFHMKKRGELKLSSDDIWDMLFWMTVGVIVGSRVFEVFWEPSYYLSNPLNFFKFWQGGMSFHGGFVGIVAAAWIYCKNKKLNFWKVADILSVPTLFALALGRIANFTNGELVGRMFEGKWCVQFPGYSGCRHPSTLYAAGKRFLVTGWLVMVTFWKEFKPGFVFWNFVFWEGLGRIIVDFYRDDVLWSGFTIGQWFSLVMVLVAGVVFIKIYKEDWKKIFGLK